MFLCGNLDIRQGLEDVSSNSKRLSPGGSD